MDNRVKVGLFALVMLITGAVDGISNLPSIALFGQQLVFFFITASILFLLPAGLVSAELCTQFDKDSGIYVWAKQAFGSHYGVVTIWLQWINTMVWFPTCLTTLVGTAAYLIDPALAHNPTYLVLTSLTAFWVMTLLNLKGFKQSARIASWATTLGMVVPMLLIIGLSALWIVMGKPLALHLDKSAVVPHLGESKTWTSLTAVITAFLGMELAAIHVRKVKDARRIFPKALVLSVMVIVFTMGLGSLGIALIIPHQSIVFVTGTVQAFNTLFTGFHVAWLEKVLGVMLVFGSLGTMVSWLISPANSLARAAEDGYLPKFLVEKNTANNPSRILILQAVVVSVVLMVFFLLSSVNGSYWLLLDLSTELYVMMYLLMFIAAIKHFIKAPVINLIPGNRQGALTLCALGLLACCITLVVGFFPPNNINVGGHWHYGELFAGGLVLMLSPVVLLYWYKQRFGAAREVATIETVLS